MILRPDSRHELGALDSLRCDACGWVGESREGVPVLLSTRDRSSELFGRYLANYDEIASDDLESAIQAENVQRGFNDRLFSYLGEVRGKRVCDIGVGKGMLFELLRGAEPARLVGVDISMPYLTRFVDNGDATLVVANAENLPFREEFDLVVAADVLEHVLNVGDFLLSVREALAPGGTFVVRVPYLDNMLQYARLNGCQYDMVHLRNFTRSNLMDLLTQTGFTVDRLRYDGFNRYRARRWIASSEFRMKVLDGIALHLLGGPEGLERLHPAVARLVMRPLVVTAITHRT